MRIVRSFRRLLCDRRGIAATEFAMILPLMIAMFLGSVELTQGVSTDRKIGLTVRAVADLVSQSTSISNAEMTNIMNAATAIMYPYSTTPLQLRISAVNIAANGTATVAWSDGKNMTPRTVGSSVAIPAALAVPNAQLIFGEVQYSYNPTFGYVLFNNIPLSEQSYVRPRQSNTISRTS